MKIYIIGPVASGKTTLARQLSEKLDRSFWSLDEIVHKKDASCPLGNCMRQTEERDKMFQIILEQPEWIIEDVGRKCFSEGMVQADRIVLLDVPTDVRIFRIIKRWIRQKIGLEKCIYKPQFSMLKNMLKWSHDYDIGRDGVKNRLSSFQKKVVVLKTRTEIRDFLDIIEP